MKRIAWVGNDVHQETVTISVYVGEEAEPEIEKTIKNERVLVEKFYKRLQRDYEIRACYEASGNGYVFYRWLKEIGVKCEVIAPSLIPKKQGEKIKTDKRDARKLGRYYRSGELTIIHVPSESEETCRSLVRLRERLSKEVRNSKQYILKFLQVRGLSYKRGSNWTLKHRRYLKGLRFSDKIEQKVFDEYLMLLEYKEESIKKTDKEIHDIAYGEEYKERVLKLIQLKGVREITAMGIITEIVDFRRFSKPRELMAYLGLIPSEQSSGETRKQGSITRTGNSRVRRLLIEASWHYRHRPNIKKREEELKDDVWLIANKAQKRLHTKYWRLVNKGKCSSKAVTAVARELTGFIWSIMQTA